MKMILMGGKKKDLYNLILESNVVCWYGLWEDVNILPDPSQALAKAVTLLNSIIYTCHIMLNTRMSCNELFDLTL